MYFAARIMLASLLACACGPTITIEDTTAGGTGSAGTPNDDDEPSLCEPDAISCDDSEYGVWRLSTPETPVVALLYMWPDGDRPRSFVSRWFVEDREQEYCNRNGTYALEGDWGGTLVFETESLGGTSTAACGGDPNVHAFEIELERRNDCLGDVFTLTAADSTGSPLYTFSGHAVHCDCTTAYDPYSGQGESIPTQNCVGD